MPEYQFRCDECDTYFSVTRRMADAGDPYSCPKCKGEARRIFTAPPVVYHTDGFHHTDYGKGNHTGTKNDALNREWSKAFGGEKPPAPAVDAPKNSSEKF